MRGVESEAQIPFGSRLEMVRRSLVMLKKIPGPRRQPAPNGWFIQRFAAPCASALPESRRPRVSQATLPGSVIGGTTDTTRRCARPQQSVAEGSPPNRPNSMTK